MTIRAHPDVDDQLTAVFEWYESQKPGLGKRLVHEYRDGLVCILRFPNAWQRVSATHRRFRLKHFPYWIVYRTPDASNKIVVVSFVELRSRYVARLASCSRASTALLKQRRRA